MRDESLLIGPIRTLSAEAHINLRLKGCGEITKKSEVRGIEPIHPSWLIDLISIMIAVISRSGGSQFGPILMQPYPRDNVEQQLVKPCPI